MGTVAMPLNRTKQIARRNNRTQWVATNQLNFCGLKGIVGALVAHQMSYFDIYLKVFQ